ncbi:uncharacterized protein LOC129966414 [Argiope bruennichi]|uniref:uncharacterized protein LOC129966414 n=1 Tax=Argiope bruennichi TaxID=94029 RepID=UPI0024946EEF|nr:uncharacterized protein LOC129966414 [Argiope bruennichi]
MASAEVGKFPEPATTIPCWAPWWAMPPDLNLYQCHMGSLSNVVEAKSTTRYMVIHTPNTFHSISPFLINKLILSVIGEVQNIKKLRSGDLLLQVSEKQALQISKMTTLGSFPVETSYHKTMNISRGVLSEPDFIKVSETEFLEELRDQNVCAARRINIRRGDRLVPTQHVVLTFQTPVLPKSIKGGYINCKIRPYIPYPLRCFKCQRYGHSQTSCRNNENICGKCAESGHEMNACTSDILKCVNCSGSHEAFSKSCPKWILEKKIIFLKIKKNITFPEARKMVNDRTPKVGVSYSSAVKSIQNTSCSQTDANITHCNCAITNPVLPTNMSSTCVQLQKTSITSENLSPKKSAPRTSDVSKKQIAKNRKKLKSLATRPHVAEDFLKIDTSSSEFSDMELDSSASLKKNLAEGVKKKKKPPDKE